jgi:DNA repair protein RadC
MEISSSSQAHILFAKHMTLDVEEFWTIALAVNNRLLGIHQNFRGTVDQCLFHPRDVFRFACTFNASKIIVAHNHPSGDPYPSQEDIEATERLIALGYVAGIPIMDHLIITKDSYRSMARLYPKLFSALDRSRKRVHQMRRSGGGNINR